MQRIFTIRLVILLTISVLLPQKTSAQSPEKMSYQAIVRNNEGQLLADQQIGIQISILQSYSGESVVYIENQTPITNANGLITIEIGGRTGFNTIDWANGIYFMKTEIDTEGGTNYTITSTSQLLSVPYALHAKTADNVTGGGGVVIETDPEFKASLASKITESDTTNWNNKLDSYTEIDPEFKASLANKITESDTTNWNNKLGSYTEIDPEFKASLANKITESDTTNWNNKLDSYTETQGLADVIAINNSANSQIKNVADPTDAQDVATKAYVDALLSKVSELEVLTAKLKDYDDNLYPITKIGNQIWMAKNLKVTHYANGDAISDGTGVGNITDEITPKYWFVYDDDLSNLNTYGRLYTWHTATDSRNICPNGWHVPTNEEWTELTDYLGGESVAGGKLKEIGTTHWSSPNANATNETDFNALPGGYRDSYGTFDAIGNFGCCWTYTENSATNGYARDLNYNISYVFYDDYAKSYGFNVRCVKN